MPCGDRSDRLDNLPVFIPVAPGCRISRGGRFAPQSCFEDRLAQRYLTRAASLAAGPGRVAPTDDQNPEGFQIDAQCDGSVRACVRPDRVATISEVCASPSRTSLAGSSGRVPVHFRLPIGVGNAVATGISATASVHVPSSLSCCHDGDHRLSCWNSRVLAQNERASRRRFSGHPPYRTPLMGVPAFQGLTGSTLQRISPPAPLSLLPYRAGRCWSLRVSIGRPARSSSPCGGGNFSPSGFFPFCHKRLPISPCAR